MAKKDRSPKHSKDPFSALRGFSVSTPTPPPPRPAAAKTGPEAPEPDDLFNREMSRLGVNRGASKKSAPTPAADDKSVPVDELALFLDALGEMDAVLVQEHDEEEGRGGGTPVRSLAQEAGQGRIVPEDLLDLHGMSRVEALTRVAWFVDNALYNGCRYLLIVTGRGRQSGEAVLREAVEDWLRQQENKGVREWCRAPARLGGEGALLLALKKS
jgi:DNA-nicking Smr family endonuclease